MLIQGLETVLPTPASGTVLLAGDLHDTAAELRERGYGVTSTASTDTALVCVDEGSAPSRLASEWIPVSDDRMLAAIVVRGYRLGAPPLALFNTAYERLGADGTLVLVIEPDPGSAEQDPHHGDIQLRLDCLSAIARRCGFCAEDSTTSHGPHDTHLIALRKCAHPPRWRLSMLDARDIAQFAALFQESFDTEISQALWQWKYADQHGCGIIARRAHTIVAHYGCTYRRALNAGHPVLALQMCDVMVAPKERGVMTKQGAMFLTAATMMELLLGLRPGGPTYGFPSGRHARLGERLGLYAEVGRVMEARWPALPNRPRLRTRLRALKREDAGNPALIERLWRAMCQELPEAILVVRDWEYLTYRYLDHPHHQYDLMLVSTRLTHRPLGLLVLRREDDALELLDILGPLRHLPLLIDQARRLAGCWGKSTVFCWITQQHLERFTNKDTRVSDLDISVPTVVWLDEEPARALKERWWLMSGDTDFH